MRWLVDAFGRFRVGLLIILGDETGLPIILGDP
jgi:hypothetical protein